MPRESTSRSREASRERDRQGHRDRADRPSSSSSSSSKSYIKDKDKEKERGGRESGGSSRGARETPSAPKEVEKVTTKGDESGEKKSRLRPPPLLKTSQKGSTTPVISKPSSSGEQSASETAVEEDTSPFPFNKRELYDMICAHEEADAKAMDVDYKLNSFMEYCTDLEESMIQMFEMRKNATKAELAALPDNDEYCELLENVGVIFSILRRHSRYFKIRLKLAREDLTEQRTGVDTEHLALQNLLYEAIHLSKQIAAVKDYKSMDQKIDLVPVEEFYRDAPDYVIRKKYTAENPHLLRIARLEWEFLQREKLTLECAELEKVKEKVTEEIRAQQSKLDSVGPLLDRILEATVPAQEFFDPEISTRKLMSKAAEYLPAPLYVLYVCSIGYQEFLENSSLKVSIHGDVATAKEIFNTPQVVEEIEESDSDLEMDQDDETAENEASDRRKLRKRASVQEGKEDQKKKLLEIHPLCLQWIIKAGGGETFTVKFYYMTKLRIVTVKSSIDVGIISDKAKELLNQKGDSLLINLFKNDYGLESPNPSTNFYFNKAGLKAFSNFLPDVGRPFKWAQKMSGLTFPEVATTVPPKVDLVIDSDSDDEFPLETNTRPDLKLSNATMETTFRVIKRRLECQASLWAQLKNLETRSIQIPPELKDHFPPNNTTAFTSWEPIDWATYKSFSSTTRYIRRTILEEANFFYRGVFERSRAKVIALVAVSLDYPRIPPIFAVQLEASDGKADSADAAVFREIEKELNCHSVEEFSTCSSMILSLQLQKVGLCIDLCLETRSEDQSVGPSEFRREKLFEMSSLGKNFRRPFQYIPRLGGHFEQRF